MSNKTPYEIRLEILQMAKEYMDTVYAAQVKIASEMIATSSQLQSYTTQQLEENIKKFVPTGYTTDELMEKANQFYSFITSKG